MLARPWEAHSDYMYIWYLTSMISDISMISDTLWCNFSAGWTMISLFWSSFPPQTRPSSSWSSSTRPTLACWTSSQGLVNALLERKIEFIFLNEKYINVLMRLMYNHNVIRKQWFLRSNCMLSLININKVCKKTLEL